MEVLANSLIQHCKVKMGRMRCVFLPARRRIVMLLLLLTVAFMLVALSYTFIFRNTHTISVKVQKFQDFHLRTSTRSLQPTGTDTNTKDNNNNNNNHRPKLRYFKRVDNKEIFLYSAIANHREPVDGDLNLIITAFDSTETDILKCCVMVKDGGLLTTTTTIYHRYYNSDSVVGSYIQRFYKETPTKAKQYACILPEIGYEATHVTLTSLPSCPDTVEDYLPVVYPRTVPGGLAICGKAAFGDQLDPNKLMEWFEVQRLLGVDHIQIMDAGNPDSVRKVFHYYAQMGLLDLLPYELPGVPYGRGLDMKRFVKQQGDHDKSFPILDCTQRLKGYTYVMGIDMDEVLVPVRYSNIKDFAKDKFIENPDAAGFFFYTQFFISDWGPTVNNSDLFMFRYLNSTRARNECKKYIYLTSRTSHARTHNFTPRPSYSQYWVPVQEAVLHHYRMCPKNVWPTCYPERFTDASLLRFRGLLEERVRLARQATGIHPHGFS